MPADALWTAATGMLAQQTSMDATANNLANVNTTGYKRGRTAFQDLLYTKLTPQEAAAQGSQVGVGVRVAGVQTQYEQGASQRTDQPLDVAIQGEGFFEVTRPDGTKGYTRAGNFTTNAAGKLTTVDGNAVSPGITIPSNASDISISASGAITGTVNGKSTRLGQLSVVTFQNPYGLTSAGDNSYSVSAASGTPRAANPGQQGAGTITQGALEMSNVNAVDEMVGMVSTQRAYEAVSKVISASDEMLGQANQLRRG
jgi:flagellar basal-body rod protein FlgG